MVEPGDKLQTEPGNMSGSTRQAVLAMISEDSGAYWDSAGKSVKGSRFKDPLLSPRVALIPFYDPLYPPTSGRTYVKVSQLGAVFVESVDSKGNVKGRFIRAVPYSPKVSGGGYGMLATAMLFPDSSRGAQ